MAKIHEAVLGAFPELRDDRRSAKASSHPPDSPKYIYKGLKRKSAAENLDKIELVASVTRPDEAVPVKSGLIHCSKVENIAVLDLTGTSWLSREKHYVLALTEGGEGIWNAEEALWKGECTYVLTTFLGRQRLQTCLDGETLVQ